MTGLDLTAALQAADTAIRVAGEAHPEFSRHYATYALEAALPHIEAALREQIAAEIRANYLTELKEGRYNLAIHLAARIAEGSAP